MYRRGLVVPAVHRGNFSQHMAQYTGEAWWCLQCTEGTLVLNTCLNVQVRPGGACSAQRELVLNVQVVNSVHGNTFSQIEHIKVINIYNW